MLVIKRDGREVLFEPEKIYNAILKAFKNPKYTDQDKHLAVSSILQTVLRAIPVSEKIGIESIQDVVEQALIKNNYPEEAKEYILYRQHRSNIRNSNRAITKTLKDLMVVDAKDMDEKRENANIDGNSTMGIMLKIGGTLTKDIFLNQLTKPELAALHKEGKVHLHDLDFAALCWNCLNIPLGKLLKSGFATGHGFLRPPQTIGSAATLACIVVQSDQNEQFGGQSIPLLDYYLAPYVAKSYVRNCAEYIEIMTLDSKKNDFNTIKENFTAPLIEYIDEQEHILTDEGKELINHQFDEQIANTLDPNEAWTKDIKDKMHEWALKKTERDTYQAMEAMIHNFCTLQCLPANEHVWVYDTELSSLRNISMEEIANTFKPKKYQVFSLNRETFKTELKYITAIARKDNNRELVTHITNDGVRLTTTTNHKWLSVNSDLNIDEYEATKYFKPIIPRTLTLPLRKFDTIDLTKYNYIPSPHDHSDKTPKYDKDTLPVTKELAEFLGYYVGDGSWCNGTLDIYSGPGKVSAEHIFRLVDRILEGLYVNKHIVTSTTKKGEIYESKIRINLGLRIVNMIKDTCGTHSDNKHIPDYIFLNEDKSIRQAFYLAYYSCDGTQNTKGKRHSITTTSPTLRDQLMLWYLYEGELGHIGPTIWENHESYKPAWRVGISDHAAIRCGFKPESHTYQCKCELFKYDYTHISSAVKQVTGSYPPFAWPRHDKNIRTNEFYLFDQMDLPNELRSKIKRHENIYTVPIVKSIFSNSKEMYVYDMEVEDNHNFMTTYGFIVSNSRAGAQPCFSNVNFGTDTSKEGRMVSKQLLLASDAGLGAGETAIFPITVFKIKKGVTDKGSPNYDLFKLSCKVSAKRGFPNHINLSASFNEKYYIPGHPETEASAMGCVDKDEVIIWKSKISPVYITPFHELYTYCISNKYLRKEYSLTSSYFDIELSDKDPLFIWDSKVNGFVKIKKVICNRNVDNWRQIKFTNGRVLTATGDHPLPVIDKGRTYVDNLIKGDKIPLTSSYPEIPDTCGIPIEIAWLLGITIADGNITSNGITWSIGPDEIDLVNTIETYIPKLMEYYNIDQPYELKHILRERGVKGTYYDIILTNAHPIASHMIRLFRGTLKNYRHIPIGIWNSNRETKLAFMAGMIDGDGYLNSARPSSRIQIGTINKALALEQAMLAELLGSQSKIYLNHYNSDDCTKIRYRVEFFAPNNLYDHLHSEKKKSHFGPLEGTVVNSDYCEVESIEKLTWMPGKFSYDVETESDRFDVSGIYSANCRTRVISNAYDPLRQVVPGRGNLFFITMNLPYLALEVKESLGKKFDTMSHEERYLAFEKALDKRHDQIFQLLDDRFEIIAKRKAKNYPFLVGQHLYLDSEKLEPDDEIREMIKHGSLVTGILGLAEMLVVLFDKHHGESEESQEYGLRMMRHLNDRCSKRAEQKHLNYGVMGSPAEGCTGRLLRLTRKRFGVIPGVTDHEYFVNSHHLPPYFKTTIQHKIDVEAPYHALEPSGQISYVEISDQTAKNVDAFEAIINYMCEKDMGYISINHPMDRDPICGYMGYFPDDRCPRCGRKDGEGVPAYKLMELKSYSPDPRYAVKKSMIEEENETTINE